MRTIALINQKGGVGKTTTTVNLGAGLARLGRRVLLMDVDPQANLSLHVNSDPLQTSQSVYDLLVRKGKMEELILATSEPGLDLIPSHIDLCSAELELVNTVGRELILREALKEYVDGNPEAPDYVLIDCPPSLGLLSLNALVAAKEVIVPIQAEFFALQGMGKLVEVVNLVRDRLNPELKITGIVICMYRSQTTLGKEVLKEVQSYFGDVVCTTMIRQNIKLAEAPGHGKNIFQYDMSSNGARDYMALAREVAGEQVRPASPEPAELEAREETKPEAEAVGTTGEIQGEPPESELENQVQTPVSPQNNPPGPPPMNDPYQVFEG